MHWDLSAIIVGALLFFAGYRIGYSRGVQPRGINPSHQLNANISDEDIKTALRAGQKIEAIKLYRQRSGATLKDAKTAVEAMDAGMGNARTVR